MSLFANAEEGAGWAIVVTIASLLLTIAFGQVFWFIAIKWHSVTGGEDGLDLPAQVGLVLDIAAEDRPGRDRRDPVTLGDSARLRPFPGPGGAQDEQSHQRKNPS